MTRTIAILFCAGGVSFVTGACETRRIDLGLTGNEAELGPQASNAAAAYGCGDWIDAELNALRVGSCEGLCSDVGAGAYPLDTKASVMAATAGRWVFCGARLGPDDAVGIEFAPGCRLFFLKYDANDVAVRGTDTAYQADYDIFGPRPENAPARIDVHFSPTNTVAFEVEANRCPERLFLREGDRVVPLARFDGHGGTGVPVH